MKIGIAVCLTLGLALMARADDKVEAKGEKVEFTEHGGYFEKNNSGLKGDSSYLTFTDQKAYDAVFGVARTMGKKPDYLAKDAFDKKMVAAVIKRGKSIWTYKVEKVTADSDTVYVQYTATPGKESDSAKFASPLIVSLDKGKYANVVFLENGKKAGTAAIGK